MERSSKIKTRDISDVKEYVLELECSMCMNNAIFTGWTKEEVVEKATEEGWMKLYSDKYGLQGHWDGCSYMDDD